MSYQALARTWRPRAFSDVLGQDPVIAALSHALEHDRTHHAYLFTGTRGVGKTTLARIFAKALNCQKGLGANPCGKCPPCRDLDAGTFVDLMELDAASHTGVANMREILDNAQYAPSMGRYKVYLIDEVHMLSTSAFNSMLKTLEEPPEHVKFLLATTDPQKIPVTVLSRCLQFNLKRMRPEIIQQQMSRILESEAVPCDPRALRALARAADGSMRDGLSLLDQAITHGAGAVRETQVNAMLGAVAQQPMSGLLRALARHDGPALLGIVQNLHEMAQDLAVALDELARHLHQLTLWHIVPEATGATDEESALLRELAASITAEQAHLYYQIAVNGQRDLPYAPDPKSGFEMTLLRMLAFRPAVLPNTAPSRPEQAAAPAAPTARATPPPSAPANALTVRGDTASASPEDWFEIVPRLTLTPMASQLAAQCQMSALDDERCILTLTPDRAQLRTPKLEKALEDALRAYYGKPLKLVLNVAEHQMETPALRTARKQNEQQSAAVDALHDDPAFQAFQGLMDARIEPGSARPAPSPTDFMERP